MKRLENTEMVQNGWGLYIAIAIILLMWFGFSGCRYINVSNPQIISDTEKDSNNMCIYYWNLAKADDPRNTNCMFRDTCYKYMIGDTVIFKAFKK